MYNVKLARESTDELPLLKLIQAMYIQEPNEIAVALMSVFKINSSTTGKIKSIDSLTCYCYSRKY